MYKNMYEILPHLLGYSDDQIIEISTDYEEWFPRNGVVLKINIPEYQYANHFISEEKLEQIFIQHRDTSIDSIENGDHDHKFPEWKVGDACYFDYETQFIISMDDDIIRGCSDGFGGSSGNFNDRCFKINPLSIKYSIVVNSTYRFISNKEHEIPNEYIINYPFIRGQLIDYWVLIMNGDIESLPLLHQFSDKIYKAIEDRCWDLELCDERIFRERNPQIHQKENIEP